MLNRLKKYIEAKGLTMAAVERSLGMSNGLLQKAIKNHTAIGSDKIENILMVYPDISPLWLFRGEGEMLINSSSETYPAPNDAPAYLLAMIKEKDLTIMQQAKEIGRLEAQIEDLKLRLEKTADCANIAHTANVG